MATQFDKRGRLLGQHTNAQHLEDDETAARLRLAECVFNNAREGICVTNAREQIIEINPTFCTLSGYTAEQLIGQTPRIFKSGRHGAAYYTAMWQSIADTGQWHGELWNRRADGTLYAARLNISAVRDTQGELTHYVGIIADITEAKHYEAKLEKLAHFDPLTGVPNRLLLADRMRQAIAQAQRTNTALAVCYLDLDGFKAINDLFGHDMGDQLLVATVQRINNNLRVGDTLARIGGDEFVLLLWGLQRMDECETTLQRVLHDMAQPLCIGEHSLKISGSVGVALYPQDGSDSASLLARADAAMYRAKQSGKNRHCFFAQAQSAPLG